LGKRQGVDIVIIPPFTALPRVSERLSNVQNIKLGAQNMHWEKPGAYTGEISSQHLRELFVRYVVLGHSERRSYFGETDTIVNKKVLAALEATLKPIVCIGETLE
jgi:triosephosphate isomerase